MNLEQIGFYTLSDARAAQASQFSPLWRCELILTGRCNFKCPYCRSVGEDLPFEKAEQTVRLWIKQGLKNIRFSGGEPTLYKKLPNLVAMAKAGGVERIALSTNGSASLKKYEQLLELGVTDFSVSLDASNEKDGDRMAGGRRGAFSRVVKTIKFLASKTYVTVGVVLTKDNAREAEKIIEFAHSLGVSDIRVIPAAQEGDHLDKLCVRDEILEKNPILKYRVDNITNGVKIRGLTEDDSNRCGLVLDDMAVMGEYHYPCIIYLREGGNPIGKVGTGMRVERAKWAENHDCQRDKICKSNCLDVCVAYNNKYDNFRF